MFYDDDEDEEKKKKEEEVEATTAADGTAPTRVRFRTNTDTLDNSDISKV